MSLLQWIDSRLDVRDCNGPELEPVVIAQIAPDEIKALFPRAL